MKQLDPHDTRLIERTSRTNPEDLPVIEEHIEAQPDLADRVTSLSDEQVDDFKQNMLNEQAARRDRIERFIEEAKAPPAPRPPVIPVNEADL